ncbi:MAG: hypothetical protein J3K34DRAFT_200224 [Monoraphidium minutum]|nr:MAG: hypothetical protein J3K34DRAFT_200224 [Monoraphidium minutum]
MKASLIRGLRPSGPRPGQRQLIPSRQQHAVQRLGRAPRAADKDAADAAAAAAAGASKGGDAAPAPPSGASGGLNEMPPMPKRGFFSIADPNAEVYSKAGDAFDPAKKPDRYKPEFIWNTNWREQLKLQEDLERRRAEYLEAQRDGSGRTFESTGVVSLSRLGALEDMNVDLTEQLRRAKQKDEEAPRPAARRRLISTRTSRRGSRRAGLRAPRASPALASRSTPSGSCRQRRSRGARRRRRRGASGTPPSRWSSYTGRWAPPRWASRPPISCTRRKSPRPMAWARRAAWHTCACSAAASTAWAAAAAAARRGC